MSEIERLLRDTIGLDPASLGSTSIQRTIRLRMKARGLKSAEQYEQLLRSSRSEWTELVEAVVVTETWFFRDREPFAALVRLVRDEWLPAHPAGRVRLLSLPSSSGEEPYSMAIALLESGLPPERFQLDAIDLSARALAKARHGLYSRNSFRSEELAFRDRWFQPVKESYLISPALRHCVCFFQANLLSPAFPPPGEPYDFIFCRNLLIYFDRPTRATTLEKLERLLAPAGVLFVGAAEQPLVLEHGFVSANLPLAFACRKAPATELRPGQTQPARVSIRPPGSAPSQNGRQDPRTQRLLAAGQPRPGQTPQHAVQPAPTAAPPAFSGPTAAAPADLEQARRLADAGQLDEAAAVCEAHLEHSRASAPGWYLLGLVHEARGNPAAIDCYRKALYLQPDHYESLLQMASLAERNGDSVRARTYKRRAERCQNLAR